LKISMPIGFTEKDSPVEGLNTNPDSLRAIFFFNFIKCKI